MGVAVMVPVSLLRIKTRCPPPHPPKPWIILVLLSLKAVGGVVSIIDLISWDTCCPLLR